jgi:hemerythrin
MGIIDIRVESELISGRGRAMSLRWKNIFSCNIREIDAQHKKLFEISAKLSILETVCSRINFEDEMQEVLDDIQQYIVEHFSYEEDLMYRYGYGAYEVHKKEHEKFTAKFEAVKSNGEIYSNPESVKAWIDFIDQWITDHTLNVDMKYKSFLNSRGIY